MTKRKTPKLNDALLDEILKDYKNPEDFFGDNGILKSLQKRLLERIMESELEHDLGYSKHSSEGNNSGNSRNGYGEKTIRSDKGEIRIKTPRDRRGDFEPKIIQKHQRRFDGFDKHILSLYSRGMSVSDIKSQLEELYGVDISTSLISTVTEGVMEDVKAWQSRSLDKIYPIVYLDALVIKVRENNHIINKAFYLALGINIEGKKELLGIWISQTEGAKFWLSVLTDLKNRGVNDILIACVDGLTGFPEAIETVYPKTEIQLCIVHQIRSSLRFVGYKNKKEVAKDLKAIYGAKTLEEAELGLSYFKGKWDETYPSISKSWENKWVHLTPFFAYPPEIRKVIYTTNAIESLNMTLRKYIKNKRVFPTNDSAKKQLYMALNLVSKRWTMPIKNWNEAMNRFLILFEDRLKMAL